MNAVSYEIATLQDVPALADLLSILLAQEAEFSVDHAAQCRGLEAIVANPAIGHVFVARQVERVVGMVNLLYTISTALGERVALLEDMVVDTAYRNGGVGSGLMDYAIAHARTAGIRRVTVLSDHDNIAAHRFYHRQGFVMSSMIPFRRALD